MTREYVFEKLHEIFHDVLDDESIELTETTSAADVEGWDSFEHINLIVATEKCFNVKFSVQEVSGMKNVGAMVDIILERAK